MALAQEIGDDLSSFKGSLPVTFALNRWQERSDEKSNDESTYLKIKDLP